MKTSAGGSLPPAELSLIDYKTTFATISPTGVLTAHCPGLVMALAMDANLNKEIIPVQVIA